MKTVTFHTLGCRLNQAETALAADDLSRHGFQIVPWGTAADVVVINTCAVTGMASQKSRQAIRSIRRNFPTCFLVVMGCDAGVDALTWEREQMVDLVWKHPATMPLSQLLPANLQHRSCIPPFYAGAIEDDFTLEGAARFAERTRANLKVQDGCNFFCSYCIVPFARGRARSRDLSDTLREAKELVAEGFKELVLCGVNLTTYNSRGADLADLLEELCQIPGEFRIRLGSSEPGPIIPKVVQLMKQTPRICRFLHLPLQYGEDTVLSRMRRHYTASEYAEVAQLASSEIPGLCLGADVIVGFPGETDETFEECRHFLENLPFGLLHVFPYSERPGTKAATFPDKVPSHLATERAALLGTLGEEKARQFAQSQTGKRLSILIEEENPSSGWSDNYLNITLPTPVPHNSLVEATLQEYLGNRKCKGRLLCQ